MQVQILSKGGRVWAQMTRPLHKHPQALRQQNRQRQRNQQGLHRRGLCVSMQRTLCLHLRRVGRAAIAAAAAAAAVNKPASVCIALGAAGLRGGEQLQQGAWQLHNSRKGTLNRGWVRL